MLRTLHVLAIGPDPRLPFELREALSEASGIHGVLVHEPDLRRGVEQARTRCPELVVLDLGVDPRRLQRALEDLESTAGQSLVTVAFRPERLSEEERSQELIIQLMRAGVRDFLRRPISSHELEALLERHLRSGEAGGRPDGRVVSFISSKGGVGKSTLAVNFAAAAARRARGRVLLVDASLQHGTCAQLLGIDPATNACDAAAQDDRLDERLLRSLTAEHPASGLRLLAAPKDAIEAARITDDSLSRILAVARRAFDLVVVDTFPLLESVTVAILDVSSQVALVTNGLVPTVTGTAEHLRVVGSIGVPAERLRVVLNRNHPGGRASLRDEDVAARFPRGLDLSIPYERRVVLATNTGEPPVLWLPRWSRFRRRLLRLEALLDGERTKGPDPQHEAERPDEELWPVPRPEPRSDAGDEEREVELLPVGQPRDAELGTRR